MVNFPGFTTLQILAEIQKIMTGTKCGPEQFQRRIIFMSMHNDIDWGQKGNRETCIANSFIGFSQCSKTSGHVVVSWPSSEKKSGTELTKTNQMDVADIMMLNFSKSGHPVFEKAVLLKEEI